MNYSAGNAFGSSAACLGVSVHDGGEKNIPTPWLYRVAPIQRSGNY